MAIQHFLTLGDVLREHRRSSADRLAVVDGGVRLTYRALDARVNQLANALDAIGFGQGDRILWLGQNSFRVLEAMLAAAKLGGMLCPANWRQTAAELAFVIEDFDPAVVIWQDGEVGTVAKEARALASLNDARWFCHDVAGADDSYESLLAAGSAADLDVVVDPATTILVLYTAAFGGRPHGAQLSHNAIVLQSALLAATMDIDHEYVYLNCGPLFHAATYLGLLPTFLFRGVNVFVARNDPDDICRVIQDERVTGAFIVGPMAEQLVTANTSGAYDLSSLRVSSFLAPQAEWLAMTSPDESPFGQRYGGYGQTEVMALATYNSIGPPAAGRHGRTSPLAQLRIVDDEMREQPDGAAGEIVVRGPIVGNGYWNRPELNAERAKGGWWHTSDLGRREPDGSITFVGPMTRMIKSAAENIYPVEVEACLESHPSVKEAAVIGVPDPRWVQSVKAIVVLEPGATASADEIIEHCRATIASYKKPRTVAFVDELPRVGFLKDYDALDAQFGGGNYPGGQTRYA